jgi:hypothetical protein
MCVCVCIRMRHRTPIFKQALGYSDLNEIYECYKNTFVIYKDALLWQFLYEMRHFEEVNNNANECELICRRSVYLSSVRTHSSVVGSSATRESSC